MAQPADWKHQFQPYSLTHGCVVLGFALLAGAMIALRRSDDVQTSGARRRFMDLSLGWIGLAAACTVQVLCLKPSAFDYRSSLPLHVCDLMMFVAPAALLLRWRILRALAYFWGLGLSSLSFIIPDLHFGPADIQFWIFWAGHATIVGTALYDVTGRRYRPTWRDWRLSVIAALAYAAVIFPIDAIFHLNYGYIGQTYHHQHSPADLLGPWPWRVPLMILFAAAVMALLLLPWTILRLVRAHRMRPAAAG